MCPTGNDFFSIPELEWNTVFYSAMAVASSAAESVQKKTKQIAFPIKLWNYSRQLKSVEDIINGRNKALQATPEEKSVDPHILLGQIEILIASHDDLFRILKRAGYTNQTTTAASISSMQNSVEVIREFSEQARLILDPEIPKIFQAARDRRNLHGTESMESVLG